MLSLKQTLANQAASFPECVSSWGDRESIGLMQLLDPCYSPGLGPEEALRQTSITLPLIAFISLDLAPLECANIYVRFNSAHQHRHSVASRRGSEGRLQAGFSLPPSLPLLLLSPEAEGSSLLKPRSPLAEASVAIVPQRFNVNKNK